MTSDDIRAIFAQRKAHPYDARFVNAKGRFRFEIGGVGVWRVLIDHGNVVVEEGAGDADCIVSVDNPDDFVRIARGQQNLITAAMQGLVDVQGDLVLAQMLHAITPGPEQTRTVAAEVTP